ncbi:hypothetical protein EYZ11_004639 [Aspergillus tanneri]|uniref:Uncharacterized protein n=1 Tax=Aspergillus tanneri TaxID=1220188 RepID=A0A4S3JQT4_9EURO|nr:hypothetical protein EYZ11_004639 [Aspergillus tanneri]
MVHRAPNTLTLIDKKAHGRKRRIISQGLSDAALRRYQPAILKHVNELCSVFLGNDPSQWSLPQNMGDFCNYLTFDIMSEVLFGEAYNMKTKEEHRYVVKSIEDSNVRLSVLAQAPILGFRRLDRYLFSESIQGRNKFIKFINALLHSRFKSVKSARQDVFNFLLDAKDPETHQGLSLAEIGAETTTLVVAGSDTSSTAFASTLFYLGNNPQCYTLAAEEVRTTFSTSDEIALGPALSSCSALWREVAKGGGIFDGKPIPAGCDVGTGIYAIHHNREYFPEPFMFRPERWILAGSDAGGAGVGVASKESLAAAQAAFNPFSIGPRGCIGKGLALAELTLGLATILYKYDFIVSGSIGQGAPALGPGREYASEYQLYDHITASKDGPVICVRERAHA